MFTCILQTFFPAMTKIVGTLGPRSQSVEIISGCLNAGMSGITLLLCLISYSFYFPLEELVIVVLESVQGAFGSPLKKALSIKCSLCRRFLIKTINRFSNKLFNSQHVYEKGVY